MAKKKLTGTSSGSKTKISPHKRSSPGRKSENKTGADSFKGSRTGTRPKDKKG